MHLMSTVLTCISASVAVNWYMFEPTPWLRLIVTLGGSTNIGGNLLRRMFTMSVALPDLIGEPLSWATSEAFKQTNQSIVAVLNQFDICFSM